VVRPLVPDVAYLAFAALSADAARDLVQVPLGAPTVAVEIRSPDDRPSYVEHKVTTYRAAGTSAVFVVDPRHETIAIHDGAGVRIVRAGDELTHPVMPGFALDVGALFARAKR
jgi:Uma2 family endonuclease